jgi:hypothetical protein
MATLDKYLPKEQVVEKPSGIPEVPIVKELVTVGHHLIYEDTSQKSVAVPKPKDPRQQSKIVCAYQDACPDKENQFCYTKAKWCSMQARVKE